MPQLALKQSATSMATTSSSCHARGGTGIKAAPVHAQQVRQRTRMHIRIDHRLHMELSWKRQQAIEAAIQEELDGGPTGVVWSVRDLPHMDRIHSVAQNKIVVVFAFSRSCGVCKAVQKEFESMSKQAHETRTGVIYCKHNVINEFGIRSDFARMYNVRHVPSFLYFYQDALIAREALPDSRSQLLGTSVRIEEATSYRMQKVRSRIRQFVFRKAPSAQRDN